jgi:hypothetical protein
MNWITVLQVALRTLSDRVLTFLSLAMVFTLACWAMNDPVTARIIVLAVFAVAVYWPIVIKEKRHVEAEGPAES